MDSLDGARPWGRQSGRIHFRAVNVPIRSRKRKQAENFRFG